jgi:3-oxoadipate enol-lactonase
MSFLSLPAGDLYYEVSGEGEALVLVSGFTADHHVWDSVVAQLAQTYQVITFDNPSCGQSYTAGNDLTVKAIAVSAIALCDHLNIEKAHFMGNSMGGSIVQAIAHQYPDRVYKAIVCCSFSSSSRFAYLQAAYARADLFKSDASDEAMVRWAFAGIFSGDFIKAHVNELLPLFLNNPYPQNEEAFRSQLNALENFESDEWLPEIKVPCLFVAGDEDALCFPKHIKAMVNKVPDAQYLEIEGVGHLPHIENPELFIGEILDFVQG